MTTLLASALREPAAYTADFNLGPKHRGVIIDVNYTAEGGATSTLDLKLQRWDSTEQAWDDIPLCSIVQLGAVGEIDLIVHPDIPAIANRQVPFPLPDRVRCLATVGTDDVTFSVSATRLA